jgi:protein TilB
LNARGEIRQCNEAKYDFKLDDWSDPACIVLEVQVPKYLDTSLLDVDVNPKYIRCVIKEKLFQLVLPSEVDCSRSRVIRARTTGILRVEMPVLNPAAVLVAVAPVKSKPPPLPQPELIIREVSQTRRVKGDLPPPLEPISFY